MYNKTLEYVKTFAKFNTTDSASAVREWVVNSFGLAFQGRYDIVANFSPVLGFSEENQP